jgi:hypothetical protein
VHQIAIISSFINPNEMKPVTLEREFEYLSYATGPIFLGFFCNLWRIKQVAVFLHTLL